MFLLNNRSLSLRLQGFRFNLNPRCEKTSLGELVFSEYLLVKKPVVSPFMIAISFKHFKYSCTLFGSRCFGQSYAHQSAIKGNSIADR